MKSNESSVTKIFIASSHCEIRINRIAPTGYAFILSADAAGPRWGFGGAREAQEMLAQGLNRAVELAFFDDEAAKIEVVVQKIGFQNYLTDFVPRWRTKMQSIPGFSRNNIPAWERLHTLYLLGDVTIRLPTSAEEKLVRDMQFLARDAATRALADFEQNRARYAQAGVFATDEDPPVAKAS